MDPRISRAAGAIERDRSRRMSVREAAAQLGLSRSRFEHLFKQETTESFTSCLRRLRLEKAKSLLADPSLRVKEVAAQCGYSTARSLERDFKRCFRLPPREWRRQHI